MQNFGQRRQGSSGAAIDMQSARVAHNASRAQAVQPTRTSIQYSQPTVMRHAAAGGARVQTVASPVVTPRPNRPHLVPLETPKPTRRAPLIVRVNRTLRTALVAFCGLAVVGYGLDVGLSSDVGKKQEQARRLNEQNTELSAQLLRAISFQGIQDSVVGRCGLRVPEQVLVAKEISPPQLPQFKAKKPHLPIMSGY